MAAGRWSRGRWRRWARWRGCARPARRVHPPRVRERADRSGRGGGAGRPARGRDRGAAPGGAGPDGRAAQPAGRGLAGPAAGAGRRGSRRRSISPTRTMSRRCRRISRDQLAALRRRDGGALARPPAERLRDGVRVVIAGPPNAGKSSLLNALAGREAAIVTALPGTTRDLIEAPVAIGGVPFLLIDTAGLRDTAESVETIGVDRARASLAAADLVLWLGAPDEAPDRRAPRSQPRPISGRRRCAGRSGDLGDDRRRAGGARRAAAGARRRIAARAGRGRAQRAAPGRARRGGRRAGRGRVAGPADRGRRRCGSARTALDRVTGRAGVEDMLDALFGRFCIGK